MNYEQLLERAYSMMPEKVLVKERFEVPQAQVVIEGNKTFIQNFREISNVLRRSMEHMAKFFMKELGVAGALEGSRLMLQSRFSPKVIAKKLNDYVKDFVLCWECGKPDTKMVEIEGVQMLVCEACGARRPLRKLR